jgi:photosystem II stability/assembly factor-like uncharacterized protein
VENQDQSAVSHVLFADALNGYVFGPALWTTHDGGGSWQRLIQVAGISSFYVASMVASQGAVYALISDWDNQFGGEGGHARLVTAQARSDAFALVYDFGSDVYPSGTLVASGSTVYSLAQSAVVRIEGTRVTTASVPPGCPGQLAASRSTDLLLVCGSAAGGGSFGNREVYGSVNSGQTWSRLKDPGQGDGFDQDGIADGGQGHAIIGTLGAGGSGLLVTSDYARTWTMRLSMRDSGAGFADLAFQSPSQAVCVHDPAGAINAQRLLPSPPLPIPYPATLWETTDGGVNWHLIHFL